MMQDETTKRWAHRLFADILDYPHAGLAGEVRECEALVAAMSPEAATLLRTFGAFVEGTPQGRVEEVYTGVFDLNPVCHPYVGYHIFGESYKRSAFLLRLKERYRACGFVASETELPDRLSIVLRFLSVSDDMELNQELISEGMLPALDRMTHKAVEAPEPPAGGDIQLEGYSQGEVLEGGFLLKSMDVAEGEDANPYKPALLALRLVLESTQRERSVEPSANMQGGNSHA